MLSVVTAMSESERAWRRLGRGRIGMLHSSVSQPILLTQSNNWLTLSLADAGAICA